MYKYLNNNALGRFQNDCVVRAIATATGDSWDNVYRYLSDIAQENGTMMDDRDFVRDYLSYNYDKVPYIHNMTVGEVSGKYQNNVVLITMNGHITCSRYGVIFDSFDPRERLAEDCWIVK